MHAYRMHDVDGTLRLRLEDVAMPEPGPGQIVLRVRAAGLNRGELMAAHGAPSAAAKPVGTEAAGEVVAVGTNVHAWQRGSRVMGRCSGAFADYALMDAREALPVPLALDWQQAGAIPLTFLVVYDMLVAQGRLKASETLFIAGVTSGVGVAALQAAKAIGARVIGTSGSEAKLDRLRSEGLDIGLHTRDPDFVYDVLKATGGRGADVVVNAVGGSVFAACVKAMAFQGRLAMVGYVDGELHGDLDLEALHAKRLHLFGVSNRLRTAEQRAETVYGFKADWLPLFAAGRLRPLIDRVFEFEHLAAAIDTMQRNEHVGKIVLAGSSDATN